MKRIHFAGTKVTVDIDMKAYKDRRDQLEDGWLSGRKFAYLAKLC